MGELMRVAKATPSEGEVGETENPKENEVDKPKNSAHESVSSLRWFAEVGVIYS